MAFFFRLLSKYTSINIYKRVLFSSTIVSILLLYFFDNQITSLQIYIYSILEIPVLISYNYDFWAQRVITSLFLAFIIERLTNLFNSFFKKSVKVFSTDKVAMFEHNYGNLLYAKNRYYKSISILTLFIIPLKLITLSFLFKYTQFHYIFNIFIIILIILFINNYISITNKEVSDLYDKTFNKRKSPKSPRDHNSHILDFLREAFFKK